MLKKCLMLGTVALLAAAVAKPAAAQGRLNLFSPYVNLHRAGTSLAPAGDTRVKDALVVRTAEDAAGRNLFQIGGFGQWTDSDDEVTTFGGGASYASAGARPWELFGQVESVDFDDGDSFLDWSVGGKIVLWDRALAAGWSPSLISAVFDYTDQEDLAGSFRALLALDHQLGRQAFLTLNAGLGHVDSDFDDSHTGFLFGIGATWVGGDNWSLSADYSANTSLLAEDDWTVSGLYRFNPNVVGRAFIGKHTRFGVAGYYQFR